MAENIVNSELTCQLNIDVDLELTWLIMLGIHPAEIIAACDVARNPENEKFWLKWVAAAIIVSGPIMMDFSYKSMAYAVSLDPNVYTLCAVLLMAILASKGILNRPTGFQRMTLR